MRLTDNGSPTCNDCGAAFPVNPPGYTGGTGYAVTLEGLRICYSCCGTRDRANMQKTGVFVGYLTGYSVAEGGPGFTVTNWPSSLKFRAIVRKGRHNIARVRRDAWFDGPDGYVWHGVQLGDNSEIINCKRTKQKIQKEG